MDFLDPSLGVLWAAAISCIWYGAYRSYEFLNEVKQTAPQEVQFVQSKKILLLPIFGSIVLLLLFFFLKYSITAYILTALISIVVFTSQFFVFAPLVDDIADKLSHKFNITEPVGFKVPKIGFIPVSGIVLFLWCSGVLALWIGTHHWTVVDGIAWCLGVTQLSVLRLPSMKMSTLLLVPFLLYDVFWVFLSPLFFHGESVMVSVAVRLPPLPLMLKVPHITDSDAYAGLGLGDIALPGLFLVYLYSLDKHLGRKNSIDLKMLRSSYLSYFTLGMVQYTLGYVVTIIVGASMNSGQPALLYLVPFTLGFSAIIAWYRGELGLMWRGHFNDEKEPEKEVEAQGLLTAGGDKEGEGSAEEENAPVIVNLAAVDLQGLSIENQQHK